jgi:hypothetical protein
MTVSTRRARVFVVCACVLVCARAEATNRFRIAAQTLPVDSTGNVVPINADLDQDILGFSVSLDFDRTKLRIDEVQLGDDVAPLDPDFVDSRINNASGNLVTGVVFALGVERLDTVLAAGSSREILKLVVDVTTGSESTSRLNLNNVSGHPGRRNVMTNEDGQSVSPAPLLVDGTMTLESSAPDIESISSNEGEAGNVFSVVGRNFGLAGLSVRVCGSSASYDLSGDERTLSITAPDCPNEGFAELEICNDFGCDSDPRGFDYITPPSLVPVIQDIQFNEGEQGHAFVVVGLNMDQPNTSVTVCGVAADFITLNGQTLSVTAPACGAFGFAELQVCNDNGCATEAEGFDYTSQVPVIQDVQFNQGRAGTVFVVVGLNMDQPNTRVLVCGVEAAFNTLNPQTLQVTAPPCGTAGFAELEVCNDDGCATRAEGFDYEEIVGTLFLRGDANNDDSVDLSDGVAILNDLFIGINASAPCDDALDANDTGDVDLSDGVYVLNFLFQGGPPPRAPFPDAGEDPTLDDLPDC